jgi:hypothetical protein
MGGLFKIEGTVTASGTLVAKGSVTLADVPSSHPLPPSAASAS